MTLAKAEILERINKPKTKGIAPIIVTPICDFEDQMGIAGIDVRLGKQFIVFKQHLAGYFSPLSGENNNAHISEYQEEIVIPIGDNIVLHPGQLIIASTFEYVCIPEDLECQVEGRSSWARMGLIIAAATTIEPGYKGVITLELSNVGTIPLELHPGVKIAQIIFHTCSSLCKTTDIETKKKKYTYSIGPGFSGIAKDKHLSYFCTPK